MRDHTEQLLDAAFAGFTDAGGAQIKPAGLAPVRATVRRRRNVRTFGCAFAAVLAIVVPVAAYAARNGTNDTSPVPADSAPGVHPSGRPVDASPRADRPGPPEAIPGAPTLRSWVANCADPSLDGLVTVKDLCDGTVTMPASAHNGQCPDRAATFTAGVSGTVHVRKVAQTDVDGDGRPETIALYDCTGTDLGSQAAVVLTRAADGIRTLGDLVTSESLPGGIHWVPDLGTDADGHVWLRVSDRREPDDPAVPQWRRYRWTGSSFTQDAGPTTFATDSRGLVVSATLTLQPLASDGSREAALMLTVRNGGTDTVEQPLLDVVFKHGARTGETECPDGAQNGVPIAHCSVPALAPGATRTFTIRRRLSAVDVAAVTDPSVAQTGWAYLQFGLLRAATVALPRATG
ncbi:hypothetical protein [Dactylosporangium sp. CS-033363]|uniref:hypothetical protein n=1 Tax=Dactylosporangium sp. CS-033363 TaxID=3239935 RepID=UPI003D8F97C0